MAQFTFPPNLFRAIRESHIWSIIILFPIPSGRNVRVQRLNILPRDDFLPITVRAEGLQAVRLIPGLQVRGPNFPFVALFALQPYFNCGTPRDLVRVQSPIPGRMPQLCQLWILILKIVWAPSSLAERADRFAM